MVTAAGMFESHAASAQAALHFALTKTTRPGRWVSALQLQAAAADGRRPKATLLGTVSNGPKSPNATCRRHGLRTNPTQRLASGDVQGSGAGLVLMSRVELFLTNLAPAWLRFLGAFSTAWRRFTARS